MDSLERMYSCLVETIRAEYPDLLTRPFEVASVHQTLIPYRLNRRQLGLDTAEEYELVLTRLLSGDRGLLTGDRAMQESLRAELGSPNPDLSIFRAFGTALVELSPEAIRALAASPTGASGYNGRGNPDQNRAPDFTSRATEQVVAEGAPAAAEQMLAPESSTAAATHQSGRVHAPGCRYCGCELPEGRDVTYCPHCGQNLAIRQCPACHTELELDWQYCITCGRQIE